MTTRRKSHPVFAPGPLEDLRAAGVTREQMAIRPQPDGPTIGELVVSGAWTVAEARLAVDLMVLRIFGVTDEWLDRRPHDAPEHTLRELLTSRAWRYDQVLTAVGEMKRSAGRCGCGRPGSGPTDTCEDCEHRIPAPSEHRTAVQRTAGEVCEDCGAGRLPRRDPSGQWWHMTHGLRASRIGRCVAEAAWVEGYPGRGRVR